MIEMYWGIGATLLQRPAQEPWGSKVLQRLAADLKAAFPQMRGFSRSNLFYMRSFAAAWDLSEPAVRGRIGALPWGHIIELLKLKDSEVRDWYAERALEHNWKLEVLEHQIATALHRRIGAAPNNLEARLPSEGAELARNVAKDPLVLDFLGLTTEAEELAIEEAMTQRMSQTLAEFGRGFAFYGRQSHLDVEGDDFYIDCSDSRNNIDLLFFHVEQLRYYVFELKTGRFQPEYAGKLNFYVAVVDDLMKREFHNETVGILICGSKNDHTVRYSLGHSTSPMAVSAYTYEQLPAEDKALLPGEDQLTAALDGLPAD